MSIPLAPTHGYSISLVQVLPNQEECHLLYPSLYEINNKNDKNGSNIQYSFLFGIFLFLSSSKVIVN